MAKTWTYKYGDNTIEVVNRASGEELRVNGELQDKQTGISDRSKLWGKLPTGEEIKASLGGVLTIECSLFIDNKLQTPIGKK